jgi:hypothetical protein
VRGLRHACVLLALVVLPGCSAVSIPPQPTPQGLQPGATASAKASGQARIATVTGTGRFGLSIRKEPGMGAERVAIVPDGFQAAVVAGPVARDGFEWYELRAPDVAGWASGQYLSVGAGQPPASSAPALPPPDGAPKPSSGLVDAVATPVAGLLAQVNRETNFTVGSSGIFVEERLKPAVNHLNDSKTASDLLRRVAPAYVRLTVARFPAASEGGEFSTLGHSIKIADSVLQEQLDVQATVIAHELQHASDILIDHAAPDSAQECVNLELRAFQTQEKVWLELTKPSPPRSRMETELDQLSKLVGTPEFARRLSEQYAKECATYAHGSR